MRFPDLTFNLNSEQQKVELAMRFCYKRLMKYVLLMVLTLGFHAEIQAGGDLIFTNGFEPCNPQAECCAGAVLFTEMFADGNHSSWGGGWDLPGFAVEEEEVVNGEGRFLPVASGYSLARIYHPLDAQDVEVNFTVIFENAVTQGVGFYVRGNGGYLGQTNPTGQGYAVFLEKFNAGMAGLGLWYENDGSEIPFIRDYSQDYQLNDEIPYRVRFQVYQLNPTETQLRAKLWPEGQAEPVDWQVSYVDDFAPLQNTSGELAVDSWSTQQTGTITTGTRLDDIQITQLCNPMMNYAAVETLVNSGLQFAEGPVWHEGELLFSDITANTIFGWDESNGLQIHNSNSGQSNGLASDQGMLLAAEHFNRRISSNDGGGSVALVDNYQGNAFNSPNDMVLSQNGTLYFTDPDYGLDGRPREIAFNGVYRFTSIDGVSAEVMGDQFNNQPNGIGISPDQNTLYWSDSQAGVLNQMTINPDGSLSQLTPLATGLTIPDGMCVDTLGNVFQSTWGGALEVFAPNGEHWGSMPLPQTSVTNCTFGGATNTDIYVTTQQGLYRFTANQ